MPALMQGETRCRKRAPTNIARSTCIELDGNSVCLESSIDIHTRNDSGRATLCNYHPICIGNCPSWLLWPTSRNTDNLQCAAEEGEMSGPLGGPVCECERCWLCTICCAHSSIPTIPIRIRHGHSEILRCGITISGQWGRRGRSAVPGRCCRPIGHGVCGTRCGPRHWRCSRRVSTFTISVSRGVWCGSSPSGGWSWTPAPNRAIKFSAGTTRPNNRPTHVAQLPRRF